MKNFINGIDFHNLEAQKYWTPTASWAEERKKQEIHTAIFSNNYIGARKMDGAFYKFIKDEDGNMELIGRSKGISGDYNNKIEWVPQLDNFFSVLPNGTCFIGEIYFPENEGSNHVTTIMGCLKNKAIERQKYNQLYYYIFDVLAYNGKVIYKNNIEDRIKILNSCAEQYKDIEFCRWAKYYEGKELWDQLQLILAEGGEGVVITKKGTCYQPGKRPAHQTIKVKKELQETIDVVIVDANKPTRIYNGKELETWKYWENDKTGEKMEGNFSKEFYLGVGITPVTKNYYNNWAGSLIVGMKKDDKIVIIGSISGLTDEVLSNWTNYKGKIAEITAMQVMDTGGLRHPKFIKWRPDLTIADTDWYRVFGNE